MLLKKIFDSTETIELIDSSNIQIFDSTLIINVHKGVEKIFIPALIDSRVTINVLSDVSILFLHNKNSSDSKVVINIIKRDAHVIIREVSLTTGNDVYKKDLEIVHRNLKTFSDYKFFGFAIDDSNLNISAKSKVLKGMSGSEAFQMLKILTDGNGIAEGQPGLLIDDFDVKASHGNSIGQVSERELFYLQTKGIDRFLARWIIIEGHIVNSLLLLNDEKRKSIISDIKKSLKIGE